MIDEVRRVRVGGEWLLLSQHAIARYHERVRPALGLGQVFDELRRLLAAAAVVDAPPAWAADGGSDRWVVLTDDIVFPVARGVLVTTLTRGEPGEEARLIRTERRKRQRSSGSARKQHGKVARSERYRARKMWEAEL